MNSPLFKSSLVDSNGFPLHNLFNCGVFPVKFHHIEDEAHDLIRGSLEVEAGFSRRLCEALKGSRLPGCSLSLWLFLVHPVAFLCYLEGFLALPGLAG